MAPLLTLIKSSIKMFVRNKQALFFTLFTPVIIMTIFGFIGFDRAPKIDVGLITHAPNEPTRQLVEQFKQIPNFTVYEGDEDSEAAALVQDERSVVLWIPGDFIPESPDRVIPRSITAVINANNKDLAQAALAIVNQVVGKVSMQMSGTQEIFKVEAKEINVRNLKYIDFLLPGIVALAVMQMSVFSVAFVFADYREKGVLKRVLATPVKPFNFIAANVVTRLMISVIQAAILIAIGVLAFKAHVLGSYWLVFFLVLVGAIMFLGLGFAISGFAKTVESVPAIANLVIFPMLFLGGTFFPLDTMPDWLQNIAKYLPLTYFSEALRDVMTRQAGFADVQNNIWWMLAWSAVFIAIAMRSFKLQSE
jgi:ABC-2 type transport system permease protein